MTSTADPWMLKQLTEVPGVRFCLIVASDGLVTTHTDGIKRDEADKIAAACSGLFATAVAMQQEAGFDGAFQQVFVQWTDGHLFVRHAGEGTRLAVVTTADIDPGRIAQAMALRIKQIGESTLSTHARA